MSFFIRFIICVMLLFKTATVKCMQQPTQESTAENRHLFWLEAMKICFPNQNFKQTHTYFEKAAEQTENLKLRAIAIYSLGLMSYFGLGVNQNFETAFKFFKQAAQQNNQIRACVHPLLKLCEETSVQNDNLVTKAQAESLLGIIYYFNPELSSNHVRFAYQFCNKAINQTDDMSAHSESLCLLGYMYLNNYKRGLPFMGKGDCDQAALDCFNKVIQEPVYSQEATTFAQGLLVATKLEQENQTKEK